MNDKKLTTEGLSKVIGQLASGPLLSGGVYQPQEPPQSPDGITADQPQEAEDATPEERCAKCKHPFVEDGKFADSTAQHKGTPFCGRCVGRCHDSELADHWCAIDAWRTGNRS